MEGLLSDRVGIILKDFHFQYGLRFGVNRLRFEKVKV